MLPELPYLLKYCFETFDMMFLPISSIRYNSVTPTQLLA